MQEDAPQHGKFTGKFTVLKSGGSVVDYFQLILQGGVAWRSHYTKHSDPSFLASLTTEETLEHSIKSAENGLSNVFKNSGSNLFSNHQE